MTPLGWLGRETSTQTKAETFIYLRITNSFIDLYSMYNCEIIWEKNSLLENDMKVQIRIPICPNQIPVLAKFLFGLRHIHAYSRHKHGTKTIERMYYYDKQVAVQYTQIPSPPPHAIQ